MEWVNKLPPKESSPSEIFFAFLFWLIIFLIAFGLYWLAIHHPDIVNSLMTDPSIPGLP